MGSREEDPGIGSGRERRVDKREPARDLVELHSERSIALAELLDVSQSGIRLRLRNGLQPSEFESVSIRLVGGSYLSGVVMWIEGAEIGVGFPKDRVEILDSLWPETQGAAWYRSLVEFQIHNERND